MENQQQGTSNQQEFYAAEMRRQQEYMRQQQYYYYKQNVINNIANGLQQINPFDVLKSITQYCGISTFQIDPQESMYLTNLISRLFAEQGEEENLDTWKKFLNILNNAISYTFNIQTNQMGSAPRNGYYGMGMNMGFQGPMGGMGMGGMPFGGQMGGMANPYAGNFAYGYGMQQPYFNQFAQTPPSPDNSSDEKKEEEAIAACKNIFFSRIYQADPLIFLNLLALERYEMTGENEEIIRTLRSIICNAMWRAQDNVLNMVYQIVSGLYNREYQKKYAQGNARGGQQQGQFNPGYQQPMGGMPFGGSMGGMQFGGQMGGGMPFGSPMGGMGGMPFGGQMGGGMLFGSPMGSMHFGGQMGGMGGMPFQGPAMPFGPNMMGQGMPFGGNSPQGQKGSSAGAAVW